MRDAIIIWLIQHFEADFLWKVSLKIRNCRNEPENFSPIHLYSENVKKNHHL